MRMQEHLKTEEQGAQLLGKKEEGTSRPYDLSRKKKGTFGSAASDLPENCGDTGGGAERSPD